MVLHETRILKRRVSCEEADPLIIEAKSLIDLS